MAHASYSTAYRLAEYECLDCATFRPALRFKGHTTSLAGMPNDAAELPDLPTDPSVVRRDRLLGAFFSVDPEMSLIQHRPDFSLLVSPNAPPQIFLLPTRDRDALGRLPKLIAEIVRLAGAGTIPTHIVAVGGGPAVIQVLKDAVKTASGVAFGFHHVDDASRLAHVSGDKLELITNAAERIKQTESLSTEQLNAALERGRALVQRDQAALDKLGGRTPVTWLLIAACGAVALFALTKAASSGYTKIVGAMGATNGDLVRAGDWWRLFASTFLHWSVAHILMNMLALYNLGLLLEPILGSRRFFILYGLSGLGAALVTTYFGGHHLSAGASGAIWGLMTAVLAIVVFPRNLLPPLFLARLKSSAWRPLVLNIFLSFMPGIDLWAHFGGGFFGFVLTILFIGEGLVPMDQRRMDASIETEPRGWLSVLAMVIAIAMVASVGMGIRAVMRG
ncbi:MAG TPA: rhomboid family intramembrane serine protease [Polyangium sp.]|nr:rhomboid family intramembrane serine protease [Polyangium sp.]